MRSLRARLTVAVAAAVLVSVGLSLLTGALLVGRSVEAEARRSLERQAAVLAAQVVAGRRAPPSDELGTFLDTQQERLAIVTRRQAALLLPPVAGRALLAGAAPAGRITVRDTDFLYAAHPAGPRAVVLLRAASLQAADWRPFGIAFLVAGLVGAGLAAGLAALLARLVARPVAGVAGAARRLARGDEPAALPVRGASELAALAQAFNEMAADLARAREAEKTFLLSVSHELKTPLTAVSGHAEGIVDGVLDPAPAAEVILREAARLERLVGDLLALARLERRAFEVRREPVDLDALAHEAVERALPQARACGVELAADGHGGAAATGDADRILQVLANLIENAVRSTPAGLAVRVAAAPGRLVVSDSGPGIAPEELPRAFERFFLYDRYAAHRRVGTGLGLALVKELTEAMGGSVAVESERGLGSRFTVSLPAAAVAAERVAAG